VAMNVKLSVRFFQKDQRVEFRCPFCNQTQEWRRNVRVENDGKVSPDPKVAFERHVLGNSDGSNLCLVRPSVDEVEAYTPTAIFET